MKILQVNPYPPEHLGGSEIFCKNISINLLVRKGIKSDILTSDIFRHNQKIKYLRDNDIKVIYKRYYFNFLGKNPVVYISNYLKKNYYKYSLIHAHSYLFFTSIQCALLKKLKNYPFILHIHGGIQTPYNYGLSIKEKFQLSFKNKIFDKSIGKMPLKTADAIISVSKKDLELISKLYNINCKKCFHIPNGIDVNKFKNLSLDRKFITFIGRLTYIKGFDIFINIIKNLYKKDKNLKFLIIGNGPLKNLLIKEIDKLPITYYPEYPYEQMQKVYNLSKILLITSRYEGLPTILLESLACGTPVISTNVGGISEVLVPNKNGYFFNIKNYEKVSGFLLKLFNNDKELNRLSKEGRKIIIQNFSWEKITNQIIRVYDYVLKKDMV